MIFLTQASKQARLAAVAALLTVFSAAAAPESAVESPAQRAAAASLPNQPMAMVPVPEMTTAEVQDDITRELIDLLSAKGLLEAADAERLIDKLREVAAKRIAAAKAPLPAAAAPAPTVASAPAPSAADIAAAATAQPPEAPKPGTVRVIYLPEAERQRIRAEIHDEVLATARAENWAQPDALPEWTKRFKLSGDLRLREELSLFDPDNSPFFIDFNDLNRGSPYDVSANNDNPPPLRNTTEDRYQPRFRSRLQIDARVNEQLDAGLRLATDNNRSPVSTNQTFSSSFGGYGLVIDRAFLAWRPLPGLSFTGGRLPNPWLSTDLIWDEDLNFDGAVLHYAPASFSSGFVPFATVGAFSVQSTGFDFPALRSDKVKSRDKYLYGLQLGSHFALSEESSADVGLAYYYFDQLNGERSSPCLTLNNDDPCDSDQTRPGFGQGGNTLFALRDVAADPSNPDGPQFQYFGLASQFREVAATGRLDLWHGGGIHSVINAEVAVNLGYNSGRVQALTPANNYDDSGRYRGGRKAYGLNLLVGYPEIHEAGQWNVQGGYKRVESDAVVDAFTDSDFHLGGSNAQGYSLAARYGIGHDVWFSTRWLSATEVSGAPFSVDVLQIDLQARF